TTDDYVDAVAPSLPTCGSEPEPMINLITPQPEIPLCSRCVYGRRAGDTVGDDELTMTIDPAYAGQITGLTLIISNELDEQRFVEFGPAIVASLNAQPEPVDVTRVFVEGPDTLKAALRFELVGGGVQTNRIPTIDLE
ncbi:MAG: hypothetical protein KDB18_07440, partial [Salinibacterium sp.]|nr:hypothetical protein [Salinibacterium sp.]